MANNFVREPIINADINTWANYELPQNRRSEGINTAKIYDDSGTLKISKGVIGLNDGTNRGTILIDTVTTINIGSCANANWCKIEVSVSGTAVTVAAATIAGATNAKSLPADFTSAYNPEKGGFYITATKRCIGIAWKNTGGTLEGVVNSLSEIDGWEGYSQSDDANDYPYYFRQLTISNTKQEGEIKFGNRDMVFTNSSQIVGAGGGTWLPPKGVYMFASSSPTMVLFEMQISAGSWKGVVNYGTSFALCDGANMRFRNTDGSNQTIYFFKFS